MFIYNKYCINITYWDENSSNYLTHLRLLEEEKVCVRETGSDKERKTIVYWYHHILYESLKFFLHKNDFMSTIFFVSLYECKQIRR